MIRVSCIAVLVLGAALPGCREEGSGSGTPIAPAPAQAAAPIAPPRTGEEGVLATGDPAEDAPNAALVEIYEQLVFSGHRTNGDGGLYHFNADIRDPESKVFRQELYLLGTQLAENALRFRDFERFEPGPYGACPRVLTLTYTGPQRTSYAPVSTRDARALDGRFYHKSEIGEPLPAEIRDLIGGASGYGFAFDELTQRACSDQPKEKRHRYTGENDAFEYYEADCLAWGEAAAFGAAYPAFFRLRENSPLEILCSGDDCGGLLADEYDVRFAADLDADGRPEVPLSENDAVGIFELGQPSQRLVDALLWVEGEEWPCHPDGHAELLLERASPE